MNVDHALIYTDVSIVRLAIHRGDTWQIVIISAREANPTVHRFCYAAYFLDCTFGSVCVNPVLCFVGFCTSEKAPRVMG